MTLSPADAETLVRLQAQGLEADDPTAAYMLQAGAHVCKCLGPEFLPFKAVKPVVLVTHQCGTVYADTLQSVCRRKAWRPMTPLPPTCCKQAHACASA